MWDKINALIHAGDAPMRERLFRILCMEGIVGTVFSLAECVYLKSTPVEMTCLIAMFAIAVVLLYISVKRGLNELGITVVAVLLNFIVLPLIFFCCGGKDGGAVIWFSLGLFFASLMFTGKKQIIVILLTAVADVACFVVGYIRPDYVTPFATRELEFFDSCCSLLIIAFTAGIVFTFQRKEYDEENRQNKAHQEELVRVSDSKDRFYANFSHEIRNPINAIVGLNEIILRDTKEEDTIANSRGIKNSGKLLLNLVNDIMDLSQIRNNSMQLVNVMYQTSDMFTELVDLIRTRAKEKELDFQVQIDPNIPATLIGDERRMIQAILNLLTNAVKYTQNGGITLNATFDAVDEENIRLVVSVADTGIGIKKENMQYLFESYAQFDRQVNGKIEGNGLGLSITKELVNLMGGDITVDSVYTKGSTFTVTALQGFSGKATVGELPILTGKNKVEGDGYERSFEASGARILVVDDDELNRVIIERLLRDTKVKIDMASGGERALELTAVKHYDAIYIDYMMPDMDGVDTMDAIRKQKNGLCRDSVIVALTGASIPEERFRNIDNRFDFTLSKPVDGRALENSLLAILPNELIEYRKDNAIVVDNKIRAMYVNERKKKIKITVDCACDLSKQTAEEHDLDMMYLYIRTANARFLDTVEVDSNNLSGFLSDSTAQVHPDSASVEEYEKFFADELENASEIIHLSLGSKLGTSYENAMLAAKGFDHVRVIDSGQISGGLALLAMTASQWAKDGRDVETIYKDINELKEYVDTNFVLPTPDLFRQKGLIGSGFAGFLSLFKMHPVLHIGRGKVLVTMLMSGDTNTVIGKHVRYSMLWGNRVDKDSCIVFNYAGLTAQQLEFAQNELKKKYSDNRVMLQKVSVSVACSTGMGTVSMSFFRKNRFTQNYEKPF